jgi:hypothetical protein
VTRDIVSNDGVYGKEWALIWNVRNCCPHRNSKKRPLSPIQQRDNDQQAEFRGDIERVFGASCSIFPWMAAHSQGYQGRESFIQEDVCTGIFLFSRLYT